MAASQIFDDTQKLTSAIGKSGLLVTTSDFMLPPRVRSLRPASDPVDLTLLPAFMLPPIVSEVQLSTEVTSSPVSLAVLSRAPSAEMSGASVTFGQSLPEGKSNKPVGMAGPPKTYRLSPASAPIEMTLLPPFMLPPVFEVQQLSDEGASACSPVSKPLEHSMGRSSPTSPAAPILLPLKVPSDTVFLPELDLESAESLCGACLDDEDEQTVFVLHGFDEQPSVSGDSELDGTPGLVKFPWVDETPSWVERGLFEDSRIRGWSFHEDFGAELTHKTVLSSSCSTRAPSPPLNEGASPIL